MQLSSFPWQPPKTSQLRWSGTTTATTASLLSAGPSTISLSRSFPDPAPIRLLIVHAKPSPVSALAGVGPGAVAVLPIIEVDLKKAAAVVIEKAKSICDRNSVVDDVGFEVVEGDARYVLCEAVERHHASMLVVGSHGYGALKRAFLGSVSDYCLHNASCSVLIVKSPGR